LRHAVQTHYPIPIIAGIPSTSYAASDPSQRQF